MNEQEQIEIFMVTINRATGACVARGNGNIAYEGLLTDRVAVGTALNQFLWACAPKCPLCGNELDSRAMKTWSMTRQGQNLGGDYATPAPVIFCCKCHQQLNTYLYEMKSAYPPRQRALYATCGECPNWISPGEVLRAIRPGKCALKNRDKPHADTPGCPINLGDPHIPERKFLKIVVPEEKL